MKYSKDVRYKVYSNCYGAFYDVGKPFTEAKWMSVVDIYLDETKAHGRCTYRRLSALASISYQSARKAIDYYNGGLLLPTKLARGHGKRGVGSMLDWQMYHHLFIYELYRSNPALPVDGYVEEFFQRFGLRVSNTTIQRWFLTIGPFKGTMRITSRYPSARDSWQTYNMLQQYLNFILSIEDHSRLVFADEKPMKELEIYGPVRRDVRTGDIPNHAVDSANSKNRYSILSAVNIKGGLIPPVKSAIIEKCTDSSIFLQFIRQLLEEGILRQGDVFIVDNCSIHTQGDNTGTQDYLLNECEILMITLPPYHPDFNPTEKFFNTLVARLSSMRSRYKCWNKEYNGENIDFIDIIHSELHLFTFDDVLSMYRNCGYAYHRVRR